MIDSNKFNLTLTPADREILNSYCLMLDGLSAYLGSAYEIVLHSLEDIDHAAIKVLNGFHTGRKEGAPITDMVLSMLEKAQNGKSDAEPATYFTTNKKGEPLRSTTLMIHGEGGRIIGILCINFYLNTSVQDFFQMFLPSTEGNPPAAQTPPIQEHFTANSSELIEQLVFQTRNEVLADNDINAANKNKEIVRRLYEQGVYHLKDAVVQTAKLLNISKNTIYLHLRNLNEEQA